MLLAKLKAFLIKNKKEVIYVTILLVLTIPLRFINLGYSDYIGDEHKAFIDLSDDQGVTDFFLTRRKGPMQFLVSAISVAASGGYRNELAIRIPFAIFSVMSVLMFYALVKKLTKSTEAAFLATLLLALNGFIVGFGRIAQYQSLNMFFSFASLYFYLDLLKKGSNYLKSTLLGTLMFAISLLSHWDAIFILPPITIIFSIFLFSKEVLLKDKMKIMFANIIFGCVLVLPFFIPFWEVQQAMPDNLRYLNRRLDLGHFNYERYVQLIDLYNPFLTFEFLIVTLVLSLFWWRKGWHSIIWFVINYGIFELFVRKPGTHIYNFLVPVFILSGIALANLIKVSPKFIKKVLVGVVTLFMTYFFYQSYVIFVDHSTEYPWKNETLLLQACPNFRVVKGLTTCQEFVINNFETPDYTIEDKLPLFGFPLSRKWNLIETLVKEDIVENNLSGYGFLTNEEKSIAQWYMTPSYRADNGFYIIGVKHPLSFREDYQFSNFGGKESITQIKDGNGRLLVKIWRVDP